MATDAYKTLFMFELLTAELLFTSRMGKRSFFPLRLAAAILLNLGVSLAVPVLVHGALFYSLMFIAMFFLSVFTLLFCYREPFIKILFFCVAAYGIQHITYEIFNFVLVLFGMGEVTLNIYYNSDSVFSAALQNPFIIVLYIALYFLVYSLSFFLFYPRIKNHADFQLKRVSVFIIVVLIIFVDIVMNAVILQVVRMLDSFEDEKLLRTVTSLYDILCCLLALYIQFELSLRKQLEHSLGIEKHLRHQEREQYERIKENIELIGIKCHDIKHQINDMGIRNRISSDFLDEVTGIVSVYDAAVVTGNKALDVILTEKSLQCNKKKIKFCCIVDGTKLDFMEEGDIYSLFGNIIDNAIEAVSELEEDERVINFQAREENGKLTVTEYNCYTRPLVFENGILQTTKADKRYHGFGLKSIRATCEKYGGEVVIDPHGDVFEIRLLFPLHEISPITEP